MDGSRPVKCSLGARRRPGRLRVTLAQGLFAVALGTITLVITGFALYVASSTMWGGRWYRRR